MYVLPKWAPLQPDYSNSHPRRVDRLHRCFLHVISAALFMLCVSLWRADFILLSLEAVEVQASTGGCWVESSGFKRSPIAKMETVVLLRGCSPVLRCGLQEMVSLVLLAQSQVCFVGGCLADWSVLRWASWDYYPRRCTAYVIEYFG